MNTKVSRRKNESTQGYETAENHNRLDYSRRNRTLEFRSQWFHLHRPPTDQELSRILEPAFLDKLGKIERQHGGAGHKAAYDPIHRT